MVAEEEVNKMYISYNNVHQLCQESADKIKQFNPDLIIAIGGGGFIPARMLRSFLKQPGQPNVRVMAIILSLYEEVQTEDGGTLDNIGHQVVRTQWIDYNQSKIDLVGKNILIIDEVDDTRTTLHYAISELKKDVEKQAKEKNVDPKSTKFGIFVLHDKQKPKKADLPEDIMNGNYFAARTVPDAWIAYPWESTDIVYHQKRAEEQGNDVFIPSPRV
ncbi:Hypoxanthine-guanine phosphoribosyltransferase [Spathaspora sp. JA1]|nr:Hypoxanthine-guanine phosphoribosyltransferase [Spathaspora sp. JA1]